MISKEPFNIGQCLAKAAHFEQQAIIAKQQGDQHGAYALMRLAYSWLEEALELEAKIKSAL